MKHKDFLILKKLMLIPGIFVLFSINTFSQLTGDTLNVLIKNTFLQLKDLNTYGRSEWVFGDVYSDDSEAGGDVGGFDQPYCQFISGYMVNECNEYFTGYWQANYKSINYSNSGLKRINEIADPGDFRQQKAEFNFFRALCYFNLIKVFGDVPLYTLPFNPDSITEPRATTDTIWNLIENDLKAASSFLPVSNAGDEKYHPTKGAADAMLTKTYIYQGEWDSALQTAISIINSGRYALEENFQSIYKLEGDYGKESIFEIEQVDFSLAIEAPWNTNLHNIYQNPRKVIVNGQSLDYSGWGFNCPTQNFVDEFEAGDPRLGCTVARLGDSLPYSINGNDTTWALIDVNYASPTAMYSRKYEMHPFEHDFNFFHPLNIKVIRYADVLLWAAEAAYNLGLHNDAIMYVNMVRARARNSGNTAVPADLDSITIQDIIHERRVELGMEGHRFFDLQRYDRAGYLNIENVIQASGKTGAENFIGNINKLFPIPAIPISVSGGTLLQNPGYGSDATYVKKEAKININVNTGNSHITLTDYFGCLSGSYPDFYLNFYSENTISTVSQDSYQLDIFYKNNATGVDNINLIVVCGCIFYTSFTIEVSGTTDINVKKAAEGGYILFPNPADNLLNITGLSQLTVITVYTVTGEKIIEKIAFNKDEQIDLSNLSSGIYLLKLVNGKGTYIENIIKK